MPDVPHAVRLLLLGDGGLMTGHGWVGPVTGIWCATRRSVMGEQRHVGLFGPAVAAGTSLRLPTWRGAACRRHVAPSSERGGPVAGKLGGAFWPARPDQVSHAMTVRV